MCFRRVKSQVSKISNIKNKIKVINNPIVPDNNYNKLLYFKKYKKFLKRTIISVGTLKDQKNHEFLIKTFAQLNKDIDAQLIIVGQVPKNKLKNLIIELDEERICVDFGLIFTNTI